MWDKESSCDFLWSKEEQFFPQNVSLNLKGGRGLRYHLLWWRKDSVFPGFSASFMKGQFVFFVCLLFILKQFVHYKNYYPNVLWNQSYAGWKTNYLISQRTFMVFMPMSNDLVININQYYRTFQNRSKQFILRQFVTLLIDKRKTIRLKLVAYHCNS